MSRSLPTFCLADMTLSFPLAMAARRVGLEIFPTALENRRAKKRQTLCGLHYIDAIPDAGNPPAAIIDSLVQLLSKF